jgi:hypothetical protein
LFLLLSEPILVRMTNASYARISLLRPHDGDTVGFEAGYIRHLEWHKQAKDPWTWFGWTVWAGERQRWFVYATFGHSAAEMDAPVNPADDERDNIVNVTPHAHFAGSGLFEYLPEISRGTGQPAPTARVEMVTVDGADVVLAAPQGEGETLWYRMIAGGPTPRYIRLRPRASLSAILADPDEVKIAGAKVTVEILSLRPLMCYGL